MVMIQDNSWEQSILKTKCKSWCFYSNCSNNDRCTSTCLCILLSGDGKFDFLVSWLVFLHIEDKNTLLERCFNSLKPGGKM